MRYLIKSNKIGSSAPETIKENEEELENREIAEEEEGIFEEDTAFSNECNALAAMESYRNGIIYG